MSNPPSTSYRQIFKSTALVGGAQVITLLVGALRMKALALLLGPAGMGLAGLYTTAVALIGSLAGLGLGNSGVRQIAAAAGSGDQTRVARTIVSLRRASLVAGAVGMATVIALAVPLSRGTFGDDQHVTGMMWMSLTLLFGGVSAGQLALLQGLRRLRDLAASQVVGALFGTVASVALVYWLREEGIVPFLLTNSAFAILLSWWFARRVPVERVRVSLRETLAETRGLLGLGLAFTASALLGGAVAYLTRVLVQRQLGMDAVGLYQATWLLSSYYVGFVLTAMATDFVPRLTAVAGDHPAVNRLVNEQAEMGVLIAVPGVLATLALAPWVLQVFYSGKFTAASDIVRWQIIGIFLRVVSWPLGYVFIAKGRSAYFITVEVVAAVIHVALVFACMQVWQLNGVGIAFALLYLAVTGLNFLLCRRLTGFRWSARALKILGPAVLSVALTFLAVCFLPSPWGVVASLGLTAVVTAGCMRGLQTLLGINPVDMAKRRLGLAKGAS